MSKMLKVRNRSAGVVAYSLPDSGQKRSFQPGETKDIPEAELLELTYLPGGTRLIADYLMVQDEEVANKLVFNLEPEYWANETNIRDIMLTGSLDEWKDFLDFAPEGAIDIAKKLAILLPLNDVAKREAMKKMKGFDVTKAIELDLEDKAEEVEEVAAGPQRRVKPAQTSATPGRRAATQKYNVTKREDVE